MLIRALGMEQARLISICGAGGKTSLLFALAREFVAAGERVLVTTTTKIACHEAHEWPAFAATSLQEVLENAHRLRPESGPQRAGAVIAYSSVSEDGHRLVGFTPELVDALAQSGRFDRILVEADGSARKPLKAPAAHEPVIPSATQALLIFAGLSGLGLPLSEDNVFRANIWSSLSGLALGAAVSAESLARNVIHPDGLARGGPAGAPTTLFLNQADMPTRRAQAKRVAGFLAAAATNPVQRVVIGCLLPRPDIAESVSFQIICRREMVVDSRAPIPLPPRKTMPTDPVLSRQSLGFQWSTIDPFLFCVHHDDTYPRGNANLGPDASLAGRDLGQDFVGKDGWRMYHGLTVPGFPSHPHRGFETVTIVREGLIDHSDSLGATARFGGGDVQWLTAGAGIVHAEMFPLLDPNRPNRVELFQIWLNLPSSHKMVAPHFTMFWSEQVPRQVFTDAKGATTEVACIAGVLQPAGAAQRSSLPPPPDSWAAQPQADVAIWTITMAPHARWALPAAAGALTRRSLYFFNGTSIGVGGQQVNGQTGIELRCNQEIELVNGVDRAELLLLQGKPIAEPVAQYGPFVMNTEAEIHQAMADYRRTQFGRWPWPDSAPVHGKAARRFATHADGTTETLPIQNRIQE